MEEKSNIFSILCFIISGKIKMPPKFLRKISAVYGEGAVTDQTCQKWFLNFHAGNFSLVGQIVLLEVGSDQNQTLIENNEHYAMQKIANILKISKSSVEYLLHQLGYGNYKTSRGKGRQNTL